MSHKIVQLKAVLELKRKRREIATVAMQGILAAGGYDQKTGVTYFVPEKTAAAKAVAYADSLLVELGETNA